MKKKKTVIIAGCLALIIAAAAGLYGYRAYQAGKLADQQNQLCLRLIEIGEYEQGRILAMQNNQTKENEVSQELVVLAAGFQSDYRGGISYADRFQEDKADEIMEEASGLYRDFLEKSELAAADAETDDSQSGYGESDEEKGSLFNSLTGLLFQVEEKMGKAVKEETMQAMLGVMSSDGQGSWESAEFLKEDNSLLSQKVQAVYALKSGNYEEAYENAEAAFERDDSFENRAMLANAAVMLESSPEQAINFIEIATPVTQRNTAGYYLELSSLYFQAQEKEKAKTLVTEAFQKSEKSSDMLGYALKDLVENYQDRYEQDRQTFSYQSDGDELSVLWNRIETLLNLNDRFNYYNIEENGTFYQFVLEVLDELYNSLIIRKVDASAFPSVSVTVNLATETEERLEKSDFALEDMDVAVDDFSLLSADELEDGGAGTSVMLVVDHSGSMDGQPLEDTKKAVASFVKSVQPDTRLGLVMFDNLAEVVVPITTNKNAVSQGVQGIQSAGGTSIWSGLKVGGDELASETGTRIIILLSDGADGSQDMIDEVLAELNKRDIYVYTIGFGGADTNYLSYIATSCKGKFLQALSSEMLGEIYSEIGQYMENEYTIVFTAATEPERYDRHLKIMLQNDASAKRDYYVGVSYQEILGEQNQKPSSDYFIETGGSFMEEQR